MSSSAANCSLPSCARPAAFATCDERGAVVLCALHRERLAAALGECELRRGERAAARRLAAVLRVGGAR